MWWVNQCDDGCIVADRTQDSNLWVLALSYFAQKEENCRQQLVDVLAHILSLHHVNVVASVLVYSFMMKLNYSTIYT